VILAKISDLVIIIYLDNQNGTIEKTEEKSLLTVDLFWSSEE